MKCGPSKSFRSLLILGRVRAELVAAGHEADADDMALEIATKKPASMTALVDIMRQYVTIESGPQRTLPVYGGAPD